MSMNTNFKETIVYMKSQQMDINNPVLVALTYKALFEKSMGSKDLSIILHGRKKKS